MGRLMKVLRGLFSPRLGVDGSAATSAPPPGHVTIGIETNAGWSAADQPARRITTSAPRTPPGGDDRD